MLKYIIAATLVFSGAANAQSSLNISENSAIQISKKSDFQNALAACKAWNGREFIENIGKDKATFRKFVPKNILVGSKDANSGKIYQKLITANNYKFPLSYKNHIWSQSGTANNKYPQHYKVDIRQDKTNGLFVTYQHGRFEMDQGGLVKLISTDGPIHELEFTPNGKRGCWELHAVRTIEE